MTHTLTLWTNDAVWAAWADRAGVDRIGLDLDAFGKADRQRDLPTWLSPHTLDDLDGVRKAVKRARLFVRSNPLHEGSAKEVAALLAGDVEVIMLPNFRRLEEVEEFQSLVRDRAQIVPLVERIDAIDTIPSLPRLGIQEIHVGLNDLSIDLGLTNRLSVLCSPVMDRIAAAAKTAGLRLGVGGLGRAHDVALPVPSDLVYAAHIRLGARGALIARSFFTHGMTEQQFAEEISRLRSRLLEWQSASHTALEAARRDLLEYAEASG